ncbi:hypothetical protein Btru_061943 [Bulinus truncatus]|nr:hypothetical protein Btru_061943 [Bulinus truncatus]
MKIAIAFVASLLVLAALAANPGDPCTNDSDCHDGCCLELHGNKVCHVNGKLHDRCNLDGHAKDVCDNCEQGLTCTAPSVNDGHYGVCQHNIVG